MNKLIELTSAAHWDEKTIVNAEDVSVICRLKKDRGMGEYSTLIMKNGERIEVSGLPSHIAMLVRRGLDGTN
jgi:hypothetical protein